MLRSRAFRTLVPALALTGGAQAAAPEPVNVLHLTASASLEVSHDLFTITLGTTRQGQDPAGVQSALRQALDTALGEARRLAQPGAMEVRTGHFSLSPSYGSQGRISAWQGSAELILEGQDLGRITQTAGRIQTMSVAHVLQALSREQREKYEREASAQAIARFRALATLHAEQFGFSGYTLREVTVGGSEPSFPVLPRMRMEAQAMTAESQPPLPVAAGKELVTVTVSGSVQLTR